MNSFRTLLLGATSQIGVFAIPRLVLQGETVLALSRRPCRPTWPRWPSVAWTQPDGINLNRAQDVTHILSCGPLALVRHWLRRCTHVERVVAFSTTSVISKIESGNSTEREQVRAILAEEQALRADCAQREIPLCILRPTLIYGCGLDRNISSIAGLIRRFGFVPLLAEARGLRQPVHAADLADLAVRSLYADKGPNGTWSLAGGATLAYPDMVGRVFIALKRRPRLAQLPSWLLLPAAATAGLLPGMGGVNAQMIQRQKTDLVFDDQAARDELGWHPRGFRPEAADLEFPSAGELRKLAGDSGR